MILCLGKNQLQYMFKPAVFALYRIFNETMFKALFDIKLLATYLKDKKRDVLR